MKPKLTKEERELIGKRILELEQQAQKRFISTKTRFDVENAIDQVAGTVLDLDAFIELYIDRPTKLSEDEVWNYLEGIKMVAKLRVERLWDAHRQREHIDGYGTVAEVMGQHAWNKAQATKKGKQK